MIATLDALIARGARGLGAEIAIEESGGGRATYGELERLVEQARERLGRDGVAPGDRVGICMRKSIGAVAALLGTLRAGAVCVPLDARAPLARNAAILRDAGARSLTADDRLDGPLRAAWSALEPAPQPAPPPGLAYLLHTSGSTGRPKGVMLTHENLVSFVEWCAGAFRPEAGERFASHAPLHFDLSVLDVYVALAHGATVVLAQEELAQHPPALARFIAERAITSWYSVPSALSRMTLDGALDGLDLSRLRRVLFAGEVFPVPRFLALRERVPQARCFNLYGPTETNVCTFFEVPPSFAAAERAIPIGRACAHVEVRIADDGELWAAGAPVTPGYWNAPDETARAFADDNNGGGRRWYRTGDVVARDAAGELWFLGRRDRMVKRRGYRLELGEIEARLARHPSVREAAAVAVADELDGVRIRAFVGVGAGRAPSLIELRRFCAEALPLYMIPDAFSFRAELPRTATGKVDLPALEREA